jgi:hypothetical protein
VNCDCITTAKNAALSEFAFVSKARPFPIDWKRAGKAYQPPRLKITLIVVSTSTGSLLSRYGR